MLGLPDHIRGCVFDLDGVLTPAPVPHAVVNGRSRLDAIEPDLQPYPGSVRFVLAAREAGLRCAVVSPRRNCRRLMLAAGIEHLFDHRIDGIVSEALRLRSRPAPDTYLTAAHALGVRPDEAAVFADDVLAVAAARVGDFAFVVGVARAGGADELLAAGADVVVADLGDLLRSR